MKKGFTLAEVLIVLVVIGILATVLLGALRDLKPDREKNMFKKAYQNTERAVGELVNDESIYPYNPDKIGFYNTDSADIEGTVLSFAGEQKFCEFFGRKLNTFSDPVWDSANKQCTFATTDGMHWIVPSNFSNVAGAVVSNVRITVDVNGLMTDGGKGPDTMDNSNARRDTFQIIVEFDGRVRVDGEKEIEYLRSHEATKEERI